MLCTRCCYGTSPLLSVVKLPDHPRERLVPLGDRGAEQVRDVAKVKLWITEGARLMRHRL